MTAQEFTCCGNPPEAPAWMACQFSPYHRGITNIPDHFPGNCPLILNDMTPFSSHDPSVIRNQLFAEAERLRSSGILLDLLRQPIPETRDLCRLLCREPPCPVIVPEAYWEKEMNAPVFLPAVPLLKPLDTYLAPWKDEAIWLECACDEQTVTVTEKGAALCTETPDPELPAHYHTKLHCTYHISVSRDRAVFHLNRSWDELEDLLKEAEKLGVQAAVGLYQQFRQRKNPQT